MKLQSMLGSIGAPLLLGLVASCSTSAPGGGAVEVTGEAAEAVVLQVTCPKGVPVPPAPDLGVDKTIVAHGSACPGTDPYITPLGSKVDYCLSITNSSAQDVHNLTVADNNGGSSLTILTSLLIAAGLSDANGDGLADTLSAGQSVSIQYGPITFVDADGELMSSDVVRVSFTFSANNSAQCLAYYTDAATLIDGPACVQNPGSCDDGSACTADACDPVTGCSHEAISCDDASACTADACDPVTGCSHQAISCDDASACTADACDPVTGCSHTAIACDDGDPCTTDACDPSAGCVHTPFACGTGATRTIGFYANHPTVVAQCLGAKGGTIDIGFVTLHDESDDDEVDVDVDTRVETGLRLTLGVLKANIAKRRNGVHRSALEKARMQAGQQLVAALCNHALTGASPAFDLDAAVATLAGTDVAAILAINTQADAFNNSNDTLPLGFSGGPADSKAEWDDPVDPVD